MSEQEAKVLHFPKRELTPEQVAYWYEQLEFAERKVEYAKRMLGLLAVENGLER